MTVGEKIRSSRVNAGLTQKELGDKMGVDSATVGKYERGILNPKLQTLEKIAAALGVTVWELGAVNSAEYRQIIIDREINKSRERHDEDAKLHQLEIEFRKLNTHGQEKALERICELTEIARFLKEKTPPEEMVWCGPSVPMLKAPRCRDIICTCRSSGCSSCETRKKVQQWRKHSEGKNLLRQTEKRNRSYIVRNRVQILSVSNMQHYACR